MARRKSVKLKSHGVPVDLLRRERLEAGTMEKEREKEKEKRKRKKKKKDEVKWRR